MRNTDLLEATMRDINDHPDGHDQATYFQEKNDCGTVACFAGRACLLSGYDAISTPLGWSTRVTLDGQQYSAEKKAIELLGITQAEAAVLFDCSNTRSMLQLMVKDLTNGAELKDIGYYEQKSAE